MAWIESQVDLGDHPKIYTLSTVLGVRKAEAVGLVHLLWHFTMKFAWRDGNLKRFDVIAVAKSSGWEGDPKIFIKGLQKSGLLDNMQVHDWKDFAGRLIYDRLYNENRRCKNTVKHRIKSVTQPSTVQYLTVPNLTVPNLTVPNNDNGSRPNSIEQVIEFMKDKIEAINFWDYFQSNGWKIGGRAPMKDWQAAARRWMRNNHTLPSGKVLNPTQKKNVESMKRLQKKWEEEDGKTIVPKGDGSPILSIPKD